MSLQNLKTYDPFADTGEDDNQRADNYLHIRIQQRNGRKTLTTLQGLPEELDLKKMLKYFKKEFACNGNIVNDEELGQVIQLQGDQRAILREFLLAEGIATKDKVKVHGF
ncbi:Eukaryotic translation initiation factor eIF-1 [Dipsacomyces acuminosporus]|nr:Eukaryotic translation initiation factor eIF-1 [Dipsacomyces acuminosporus]